MGSLFSLLSSLSSLVSLSLSLSLSLFSSLLFSSLLFSSLLFSSLLFSSFFFFFFFFFLINKFLFQTSSERLQKSILLCRQLGQEIFLGLGNLRLSISQGDLLGIPPLLLDTAGIFLGCGRRVCTDCLVCISIHSFHTLSSYTVLDVPRELLFVGLLFLETRHVISHMLPEDVVTVNLSV